MTINASYVFVAGSKGGISRYSRIFYISLILALLFASLPMAGVFAAPARVTEEDNLEQEWKNKLSMLQAQNLFYAQVRVYPVDYEDLDQLAQAHELLNKYGFALKQANNIVFTSAGFDLRGKVTDEKQAVQTLEGLATNLQIMRGLRAKIEERGYRYYRVR